MKNYKSKNDNINDSNFKKIYIYPIYPRDSEIHSDKRFVKFDNGQIFGVHWVYLLLKPTKR